MINNKNPEERTHAAKPGEEKTGERKRRQKKKKKKKLNPNEEVHNSTRPSAARLSFFPTAQSTAPSSSAQPSLNTLPPRLVPRLSPPSLLHPPSSSSSSPPTTVFKFAPVIAGPSRPRLSLLAAPAPLPAVRSTLRTHRTTSQPSFL
jgi:hypothetical protein